MLRAMKAEKKKREAAFYFINTEATVDKCAHWQELDCAVITDDVESDEPFVSKGRKANQIDSSSDDKLFPPDDTNDTDAAAATAAKAACLILDSPIVDSQLQSEYGDQNVTYVEEIHGVECLENKDGVASEKDEQESDLPNFDLIFHKLNKLDSSNELLDVKT